MRDAAAGRRMLQAGNPRHVGFEHDHQIGVGEQRARLEAEMHGVARRQADAARIVRDHGNGAALGKSGKHRHGGGSSVAAMISGRSAAAIHSASVAIAFGSGCVAAACGRGFDRRDRFGERRRQRLARQHQIDRPARMRHRHFHRTRDHVADLAGHAQFVIPLHHFAHHAGLVEHFLRPVDRPRARAERALLGDRRAAGGENQRHAVARQVGEIVDRVAGADIDMHHHRLRAAVHQIGAVRHGDREVLMRHQNGLGHLGVGLLGAAEGFDDRREIGARIAEEIIGAVIGERAQEGFGGDRLPLAPGRCGGHCASPLRAPAGRMRRDFAGTHMIAEQFFLSARMLTTEPGPPRKCSGRCFQRLASAQNG